jgi:hypothetical protein
VLWAQDLRLKHLSVYALEGAYNTARGAVSPASTSTSAGLDPSVAQFGFELIVAKTRKRAQTSLVFACEDEASKLSW